MRIKEELERRRWEVPPCNILYLLQSRAGSTPVAVEGPKVTGTVLKPEDIEIKEIHILRGYHLLSKASRWAALKAKDISLLLF